MAGPKDDFDALIYQSREAIGTLLPDCVIEETYEDTTQITSHPVERGANMSDHAFMLPMGLDMKVAWADYKGESVSYSTDKYKQLLAIQAKLEPLTISTGKRLFENMMIVGVSVTNDQKTKHAVLAHVRLKEIRQAGIMTAFKVTPPPPEAQAQPKSTQPVTDLGRVTPLPTGTSQVPPKPDSPPDSTERVTAPSPPPQETALA